jgi:sigma-B regulation protein RsbU (phosphoserine phosphatase)
MRQTQDNEYKIFEPLEVITNLNIKMVEQQLAGCLFATCCYCLLNTDTLKLSYSRAGHPYPILVRKGNKPVHLEERGGLLGVFKDAVFEQKTIQLEKGNKLFIYSDGAEPLIGNCDEKGDDFIFTGHFTGISELSIDEMQDKFSRSAAELKLLPKPVDDITAVGLEIL